jgi:hypothetical protein
MLPICYIFIRFSKEFDKKKLPQKFTEYEFCVNRCYESHTFPKYVNEYPSVISTLTARFW